MDKHDLRKIQKEKRSLINIQMLSELIIDNLFALKEFRATKNIFSYISISDEISTARILKLKTKNIFAPKIVDKNLVMAPFSPHNLHRNKYGILEPKSNEIVLPKQNDVIIVPALGCDFSYNRLGYGGGFYDRYLKNTNSVKIVLLPQELIMAEIPTEQHDVKVDIIVTESLVFRKH